MLFWYLIGQCVYVYTKKILSTCYKNQIREKISLHVCALFCFIIRQNRNLFTRKNKFFVLLFSSYTNSTRDHSEYMLLNLVVIVLTLQQQPSPPTTVDKFF